MIHELTSTIRYEHWRGGDRTVHSFQVRQHLVPPLTYAPCGATGEGWGTMHGTLSPHEKKNSLIFFKSYVEYIVAEGFHNNCGLLYFKLIPIHDYIKKKSSLFMNRFYFDRVKFQSLNFQSRRVRTSNLMLDQTSILAESCSNLVLYLLCSARLCT